MFRSRSWFGSGLWKPKNPHSLEHLKYLYNVLSKNQTVSENNRGLLVETLRSIAEILIWGDQNDSSVFDFFLEKNMLSFFLKILKQKCGSYVCVQLLQTLNILFENIRNETSLYYLLSNNHVNSIIVHKFDFSDEEVMAYYISFLKTLSLKLNSHTVHFFYNEHTNDFPLYTEAIKFFKHTESMVRIAVRTLTLNVYRVDDKSMLRFIRNRTAAPYFSNLVWFIGNHVLELDACVCNDADHQSKNRLSDLVAEHLDHLHYLNDILSLEIDSLNQVLADHLLNKLFIPLYVFSLVPPHPNQRGKPRVSSLVSLFLLSQVFLITAHQPLVHVLAEVILSGVPEHGDNTSEDAESAPHAASIAASSVVMPGFMPPAESLEQSLDTAAGNTADGPVEGSPKSCINLNITDEEKQQRLSLEVPPVFLEVVVNALDCRENDYACLFALCLLHAMSNNKGVAPELLDGLLMPSANIDANIRYNSWLVERLINIITVSCQPGCRVRLATLELCVATVSRLVTLEGRSLLLDGHLAALVGAREGSTSLLRNLYKSEDIFLDMFEAEHHEMKKRPLNVEFLMMDSNILLPPTGTPMTGIEFTKRLPCGEVERARRAIRVFLLVRELCCTLTGEPETQLPLTNRNACVQVDNILDLNNSDLIACTVMVKDGAKLRRFLVMDSVQLLLVEPDPRRLGWGIAKLAAFLQDIEVTGDKEDSRCLHVMIHNTAGSPLATWFWFDDHIRCLAAKQRMTKGRLKARQKKMLQIARLLDLPSSSHPSPSPPPQSLLQYRQQRARLLVPRPLGPPLLALGKVAGGPRGPSPTRLQLPRSEEIALEDILAKRGAVVTEPSPAAPSVVMGGETVVPVPESRETSFSSRPTAGVGGEGRLKGQVETV